MNTISIEIEKREYTPSEELAGEVSWQLEVAPEAIEIRLFWYTSGKGDRDTHIEQTKRYQRVTSTGSERFTFTLPAEPYSFSGKLISLLWAIEIVAQPGADSDRVEFVMAPEGKEVLLSNASA